MGWKGTIRSMNAAANRYAREAERRDKAIQRQQISDAAAAAVDQWEIYLDKLSKIHVVNAEAMDWHEIANAPAPCRPVAIDTASRAKKEKLAKYDNKKEGLLFRKTEAKRNAILNQIMEAEKQETAQLNLALEGYNKDLEEWKEECAFAKRVLSNDEEAIFEVFKEKQSLAEESMIGTAFSLNSDGKIFQISVNVFDDSIVPKFRRKQLASGKLSETNMPKAEFNELYQDYVVSAAIRAAIEAFNITCLEEVYVDCVVDMLDTSTGRIVPQIILSVRFVRETIDKMNLEYIDPSDSLSNFVHSMKFSRTKGFSPVETIGLSN